MRPESLKSRIFADSGDPDETRELIKELGFLDGQTTNPSLVAKNPEAKARIERGEKFTLEELNSFYREIILELSKLIPDGSVSIEVYADEQTTADAMLGQAREYNSWIANAHIKFPTTHEGLQAAAAAVKEGMKVNMTLVFSQAQAAAVYAATKGAKKGDVFISPFVGRLDDRGEDGMSLIENIIKMYEGADGHVEVLTASVRTIDHFLDALKLGSDIITAPTNIIKEWAEDNMPIPGTEYKYDAGELSRLEYQELDLDQDWQKFDIRHELTDKGQAKFAADWNILLK